MTTSGNWHDFKQELAVSSGGRLNGLGKTTRSLSIAPKRQIIPVDQCIFPARLPGPRVLTHYSGMIRPSGNYPESVHTLQAHNGRGPGFESRLSPPFCFVISSSLRGGIYMRLPLLESLRRELSDDINFYSVPLPVERTGRGRVFGFNPYPDGLALVSFTNRNLMIIATQSVIQLGANTGDFHRSVGVSIWCFWRRSYQIIAGSAGSLFRTFTFSPHRPPEVLGSRELH